MGRTKNPALRGGLALLLIAGLFLVMSSTALAQAVHADQIVRADQIAGPGAWLSYWLSNDIVQTLLLIVGIAGVVIEIITVGSFGIFGVVGIAAFGLYFWGSFQAGDLTSLVVWLIIGGIILLAMEIFVIPGFGVPGILGIVAILGALVLSGGEPQTALISLAIALVASAAIIWFTVKNKRTRRVWGKLILGQKSDSESGYDSVDISLARFQGQQGRALTTLRPAGAAEIGGERVDVVTKGEFIEPGRPILVELVEGMRVVVRELDPRDISNN